MHFWHENDGWLSFLLSYPLQKQSNSIGDFFESSLSISFIEQYAALDCSNQKVDGLSFSSHVTSIKTKFVF